MRRTLLLFLISILTASANADVVYDLYSAPNDNGDGIRGQATVHIDPADDSSFTERVYAYQVSFWYEVFDTDGSTGVVGVAPGSYIFPATGIIADQNELWFSAASTGLIYDRNGSLTRPLVYLSNNTSSTHWRLELNEAKDGYVDDSFVVYGHMRDDDYNDIVTYGNYTVLGEAAIVGTRAVHASEPNGLLLLALPMLAMWRRYTA